MVEIEPYTLNFKELAITSRASMRNKLTYLLRISEEADPHAVGVGEINLFQGLSAEDGTQFQSALKQILSGEKRIEDVEISSIRFGYESALWSLRAAGGRKFFDTPFTRGEVSIPINGLVWMGDHRTMLRRMREKLDAGFRCVKIKIGGIDFNEELELLTYLRHEYSPDDVELRLDANGAFSPDNAINRLNRLAQFGIHSIEQPIRQGQPQAMARVCRLSPIPVALDEELIGWPTEERIAATLDVIKPAYIILKPALCGGFAGAERWIKAASERDIGWWATSALESNIGLNAIAQWVSQFHTSMPQGLGTGQLYTNNFPSPLHLKGSNLHFLQ